MKLIPHFTEQFLLRTETRLCILHWLTQITVHRRTATTNSGKVIHTEHASQISWSLEKYHWFFFHTHTQSLTGIRHLFPILKKSTSFHPPGVLLFFQRGCECCLPEARHLQKSPLSKQQLTLNITGYNYLFCVMIRDGFTLKQK